MIKKKKIIRRKIKRKDSYFVYMIKCANGFFYTGFTNNITRRVKEHREGRGAKYLRGKGPLVLIYKKKYTYFKNAFKEERRIKRLSKPQKQKLVESLRKAKKRRRKKSECRN